MPQMRLLKDAISAVKVQDPDTALTAHAIRMLALTNKIKSVRIGKRRLINIDSLFEYLSKGEPVEQPEETGITQRIRLLR